MKLKTRIETLEGRLREACFEVYNESAGGRRFKPMRPWVLVRVLPKEHTTPGGIILAEKEQNKIAYEGLVIEVWEPYEEIRRKRYDCAGTGEHDYETVLI